MVWRTNIYAFSPRRVFSDLSWGRKYCPKRVKSIVVKDAFIVQKLKSNKIIKSFNLINELLKLHERRKYTLSVYFLSLTVFEVNVMHVFYRNHFKLENVCAFLKTDNFQGSKDDSTKIFLSPKS